jgi:hypothetical protein
VTTPGSRPRGAPGSAPPPSSSTFVAGLTPCAGRLRASAAAVARFEAAEAEAGEGRAGAGKRRPSEPKAKKQAPKQAPKSAPKPRSSIITKGSAPGQWQVGEMVEAKAGNGGGLAGYEHCRIKALQPDGRYTVRFESEGFDQPGIGDIVALGASLSSRRRKGAEEEPPVAKGAKKQAPKQVPKSAPKPPSSTITKAKKPAAKLAAAAAKRKRSAAGGASTKPAAAGDGGLRVGRKVTDIAAGGDASSTRPCILSIEDH